MSSILPFVAKLIEDCSKSCDQKIVREELSVNKLIESSHKIKDIQKPIRIDCKKIESKLV